MSEPALDTPTPAPAPVDSAPAPVDPAPSPAPADPAPTDPAPAEPKADWPEDWRNKLTTDPKLIKRLERYASPKAAIDALFAAQNRISSGELKSALKPDATPEEKAAWRTENGIPATPAEYDTALPNGLVIGDADKPFVDAYLAKAHEANLHPSQVKETLAWYFDQQEQARVAQDARDLEAKMATEDTLRAEYGQDYRRVLGGAFKMLEGAPDGVKDKILGGRTADGTPIGSDPAVIRWLVDLNQQLNPIATLVPGSGTNAVQAAENELADIRKMMGDHKSDYWKGPRAGQLQARYRELTSAMASGRGR